MNNNTYRLIINSNFNIKPIISYGLIVYAKNTDRWVLVQRKHSVEFILYMKGWYELSYLSILLNNITLDEKYIIYNCLSKDPEYFINVYLNELYLPADDLSYALIRVYETYDIVINLINHINTCNNELSWNWPKGRINNIPKKENSFDCAKREFEEEVEINLPPYTYLSDNYLTENINTVCRRNIESRYWIYVIDNEITIPEIKNNHEVSNRKWATTDECFTLIKHKKFFEQVVDIVTKIK